MCFSKYKVGILHVTQGRAPWYASRPAGFRSALPWAHRVISHVVDELRVAVVAGFGARRAGGGGVPLVQLGVEYAMGKALL